MTPTLRRLVAPLLLLIALCSSAVATAQKSNKREAKEFAEQGAMAYKVGHFQEALDKFTKAYAAFPAPLLLFNLGQCQRELGNHEKALFFLRNYLHEDPKTKYRALVEELIVESEKKLAAQREDEQQQTRERAASEAAARLQSEAQLSPPPLPPPSVPMLDRSAIQSDQHSARIELYSGLGIAAAGLVAVGVGVYCGLRASSDASTLNQLASGGGIWTSSSANTYQEGSHLALTADVLYGAGAAVAVVGGVIAFLGWNGLSSADARLSIAMAPSPTGGQVALSGVY